MARKSFWMKVTAGSSGVGERGIVGKNFRYSTDVWAVLLPGESVTTECGDEKKTIGVKADGEKWMAGEDGVEKVYPRDFML